jgi:hypothetical protein
MNCTNSLRLGAVDVSVARDGDSIRGNQTFLHAHSPPFTTRPPNDTFSIDQYNSNDGDDMSEDMYSLAVNEFGWGADEGW